MAVTSDEPHRPLLANGGARGDASSDGRLRGRCPAPGWGGVTRESRVAVDTEPLAEGFPAVHMDLYRGMSVDFISDAVQNRIGAKLAASFEEQFRYQAT